MTTKRKAISSAGTSASNAVDRQLARYREMRDFSITSEPSGKTPSTKASKAKSSSRKQQLPFVIQKHAASHLHYDFRLGCNGVLKSWAIAKGPSYFPGDKRLAVQVEDHPMEYGGFEGVIPQGQYGGGTVMLWDQGTWEPQPGHTDVDEGLRSGSLKFIMHGVKMKGKWALVRMSGKAANERKPNWLLIKEHDEFEHTDKEPNITDTQPDSVVTGRNLEQIAHSRDHIWNSKETATGNAWYRNDSLPLNPKESAIQKETTEKNKKKSISQIPIPPSLAKRLRNTPREKLPAFIPPQLALQSTKSINAPGWLHELKLDGYRIQGRKDLSQVQLLTRTGLDWTHRMKPIANLIKNIPAKSALLDGEVVVLAEDGTTSFADLQAAFQEAIKKPFTYFAFDLLHLDEHNLRGLELIDRKALLRRLLENAPNQIRFSEHLEAPGDAVFRNACKLHAEGILSKRAAGKYISGRSGDWLKRKCIREQEFIVGGFTMPSNKTHGIGALLLGYFQDGKLIYAGRAGTGFTQKTHRLLRDQLEKLRQPNTPFDRPPIEARRGASWVKPKLVAQIRFATWTADGLVRQAAFKGLREDKSAREVRREEDTTISPKNQITKHAFHAVTRNVATKTTAIKAPRPKPSESSASEHAPIRLTHPEKLLDIKSHLTKQELADYYWAIAPHMLPYIANRPLSLVRCPEGSEQPCFYQKHANHMLPPGIESIDVPDKKTGKTESYITLSTPEALAGLAQMSVLEVHPWGSTDKDLEHPNQIIIDLDPDATISWRTLANSAAEVHKNLKKIGLESFLKITGGKGLHVVVPIMPEHGWSTVKQFAHAFALMMEEQHPDLYLTKMSKAARKDRIYLDYLRNERGATAIAAFSPRSRAGCPVSLPLSWSELKLPERPVFQVAHFNEWKNRLDHDPWKNLLKTKQRIVIKASKPLDSA